jgi:periplasmic protein CpxP/Spy
MSTFKFSRPSAHLARPLRVLLATALLALAGGVVQTAQAAPGGHDGMVGHAMSMGMGKGGGMAHPEHLARLLDSIGASADQQAQIKQIMATARTELQAQRTQGQALHQQMQAVFTQPAVDARAAEALRQQLQAVHDQSSKRMLQAMLDSSRVLTPDQRAQLATKLNQRHGLMERHRAERAALDKAPR